MRGKRGNDVNEDGLRVHLDFNERFGCEKEGKGKRVKNKINYGRRRRDFDPRTFPSLPSSWLSLFLEYFIHGK